MRHTAIRKAFEEFLRERDLKLTPQRSRVFERAYETHDHFSAEEFYTWMRAEEGARVSRATVYRTLARLVEGGVLEQLDAGGGETLYEHVVGHRHHDHLVCTGCGRIEEFVDDVVEERQVEIAERFGFQLESHSLRLFGPGPSGRREPRGVGPVEIGHPEAVVPAAPAGEGEAGSVGRIGGVVVARSFGREDHEIGSRLLSGGTGGGNNGNEYDTTFNRWQQLRLVVRHDPAFEFSLVRAVLSSVATVCTTSSCADSTSDTLRS